MTKKTSYIVRLFNAWLIGLALLLCLIIWSVVFHHFDTDTPLAGSTLVEESPPLPEITVPPVDIPPFDKDNSDYILLVFPTQGGYHLSAVNNYFALFSSEISLVAQLFKRGELPEPVTEGVLITYTIEGDMVDQNDKPLPKGDLVYKKDPPGFVSDPINLSPYTSKKSFMPYPTAFIEAKDTQGKVLIATRVTLPVTTEIGCKNCHSGSWKVDNRAGISDKTAQNIVATHDKYNKTEFLSLVKQGIPIDCQSCHFEGGEQENLSTAIHGFHATLQIDGEKACYSCHPSSPTSTTKFFHDFHSDWGLTCISCHGSMPDNAISLLKNEINEEDKGLSAKQRLKSITPLVTMKVDDIIPRKPWVNLPDCTSCHNFITKPDPTTASAFNKWTKDESALFINRTEDMNAVRCASCHGVPHSVYPSNNPLGDDRDNIQPIQYQGIAAPMGSQEGCFSCHKTQKDYFIHHEQVQE